MDLDAMTTRTQIRFEVSGTIDSERQQRAEAILGRLSYRLLASKAYRFDLALEDKPRFNVSIGAWTE